MLPTGNHSTIRFAEIHRAPSFCSTEEVSIIRYSAGTPAGISWRSGRQSFARIRSVLPSHPTLYGPLPDPLCVPVDRERNHLSGFPGGLIAGRAYRDGLRSGATRAGQVSDPGQQPGPVPQTYLESSRLDRRKNPSKSYPPEPARIPLRSGGKDALRSVLNRRPSARLVARVRGCLARNELLATGCSSFLSHEAARRGFKTCFADQLCRSRAPVLQIHGACDRLIPSWHGIRSQPLFRDSELEIIPGCGHWLPREEPDLFCKLVTRFLDQRGLIDS